MQIAVAKAKGYKPSVYKEMNLEGFDKSKGIRYYGIAVEADLPNLLEGYFSEHPEHRSLYDQLKASKRIETRPHVTLVHEKERNAETTDEASSSSGTEFARMLWDKCETLTQRWGTAAVDVKLTLGPLLCWDSRVMSIQVSHVEYSGAGLKREDMPNDDRKGSYHITIGTLSSEIRPVEGKLLLESATQGEIESAEGGVIVTAQVPCVEVTGRIRGLW
jgi:tRNA ligase